MHNPSGLVNSGCTRIGTVTKTMASRAAALRCIGDASSLNEHIALKGVNCFKCLECRRRLPE
jgi:hypothetical protein